MAEFKDVMLEWQRMCEYFNKAQIGQRTSCDICPLHAEASACAAMFDVDPKEWNLDAVQAIVMEWAKNNPRPVYPTWFEFISSMKDFPWLDDYETVKFMVNTRIPDDVAQKLGLQPKREDE